GEGGVGELRDLGDVEPGGRGQAASGEGTVVQRGPPAAAQRRRGDQADDRTEPALTGFHQGDQGGPDRDTAHVVLGAVDGVDHPAPGAGALDAVLLAEDRVPRAGAGEVAADEFLRRLVRL